MKIKIMQIEFSKNTQMENKALLGMKFISNSKDKIKYANYSIGYMTLITCQYNNFKLINCLENLLTVF
jgi:hypothetical protein